MSRKKNIDVKEGSTRVGFITEISGRNTFIKGFTMEVENRKVEGYSSPDNMLSNDLDTCTCRITLEFELYRFPL